MVIQTRKEQLKEIEYQTKMLNNLKKWIQMLILISSVGIACTYWSLNAHSGGVFHLIGFISVVITILSVLGCIIIGLGYKKGRTNVDKILKMIEQNQ
ncbi:MAG TPA: DUF202 domain-containing protein [Candidatus Fimousia stercorigallinarum]|nr:DUF202 domain-containing protein [Candidatus Fimousia stercorigallinarum]